MRVYSTAETHAALPWAALAAALEAAFIAGHAVAPRRHAHALAPGQSLLLMPAWDEAVAVTKIVTVIPGAPKTVQASLVVLDRASGEPLAMLDGEAVTLRRTAATSAIAARRLAPADASTLLLVGTGQLAPWMARAHAALRPALKRILVWGRSPERAAALTRLLAAEGLPAESVVDLPSAAAAAQIVCCATTASAPVIHGEWLSPGTHLDLVGAFRPEMREADDAAIARCRIVVDTFDGALAEGGDLVQAIAAGVIAPEAVACDLAALLRGAEPPARAGADGTLFKSVGSAIEDLAAAALVVSASA